MKTELIEKAYAIARERYAEIGVDTEKALAALQNISLSLHCWQADDVTGFENRGGDLTGGIQATGNYPGKARNIEELRADILKAKSTSTRRRSRTPRAAISRWPTPTPESGTSGWNTPSAAAPLPKRWARRRATPRS